MNQNDIIAEYVKKEYPEILKTMDFAVFNFKMNVKNIADSMVESFKKMDLSNLKKAITELNEKAGGSSG